MFMTSGNGVVDAYERLQDRIKTCKECHGNGKVSWDIIKDGMELMHDEISIRIYKRNKAGFPVMSYRQALKIEKEVRKEGADCPNCDGTGEVEL
jgi:RecJ-like exonuclease